MAEVRFHQGAGGDAMPRNVLRVLATMLVTLGLLTLGVTPAVAQQELTVEATIDQATIDPRTGEVTLTGTVTCSGVEEFVFVEIRGQLVQRPVYPHPHTVWAPFHELVAPCTPEGATFSLTFTAVLGTLRPGPAHLTAFFLGCVPVPFSVPGRCAVSSVEQLDTTVRLTPAH
jgi:hypothetical protein